LDIAGFRLKHPSERRPLLPRERAFIFWPWFVGRLDRAAPGTVRPLIADRGAAATAIERMAASASCCTRRAIPSSFATAPGVI